MKKKLVFDIGANIGNTVDYYNTSGYKVVAVEPNDDLVKYLTQRFENKDVNVVNKLISDNIGVVDFYLSNANTISTASTDWITKSRFTNDYTWYAPIKKESTTIDQLIEEYGVPDIIKIDVEGYEHVAIKGLTKNIDSLILFEWAEEEYSRTFEVVEHLMSLGYTKFGYTLNDDLTKPPTEYDKWGLLEIHENINIKRKELWGMIYAKK